jgi:MOSC domain-containing protein YiiM
MAHTALSVHGGLAKAVYAYPLEHYDFWRNARREAMVPGPRQMGIPELFNAKMFKHMR